jgi:MYND finger
VVYKYSGCKLCVIDIDMTAIVVFDFDQTLTWGHLFSTLRKHKASERQQLLHSSHFIVDTIFGGYERIKMLEKFVAEMKLKRITLAISSHGMLTEIQTALSTLVENGYTLSEKDFKFINANTNTPPTRKFIIFDTEKKEVVKGVKDKIDFIQHLTENGYDRCIVFADDDGENEDHRYYQKARTFYPNVQLIDIDKTKGVGEAELNKIRKLLVTCVACNVNTAVGKCAQCKSAVYCGEECQAAHWTRGGHSKTCGFFY